MQRLLSCADPPIYPIEAERQDGRAIAMNRRGLCLISERRPPIAMKGFLRPVHARISLNSEPSFSQGVPISNAPVL